MKVKQLLNENGRYVREVTLDFNDLEPLQIAALKRINNGNLDVMSMSDKMLDVIYSLQYYNLVDSNYNLTPTGVKAVRLAHRIGSKDRRRAASMKDVDIDQEDVYDTDYPNDDDMDDYQSPYDNNRYGSINDVLG